MADLPTGSPGRRHRISCSLLTIDYLLVGHDSTGDESSRWAEHIDPRCERFFKQRLGSDFVLFSLRHGDIMKRFLNMLFACDFHMAGFIGRGQSQTGKRFGRDAPRALSFFDVLDPVRAIVPGVVVLANVFSLLEKNMEDTWFIILDELERLASEKDYTFDWAALHARNHCTPMRWPRIFMLLCKNQHYDGRFLVARAAA